MMVNEQIPKTFFDFQEMKFPTIFQSGGEAEFQFFGLYPKSEHKDHFKLIWK
jgi:hypothetical protein